MNRFKEISEDDTSDFVEKMKNENTARKTSGDVKLFVEWLVQNGEERSPEIIEPATLDTYLARFVLSVRKKDKTEYEPDSIKSMHCSISRFLLGKKYPHNILKDRDFQHSRDVLFSKRKSLKAEGLGNKKRKADPFTHEEIKILYDKNLLGSGNPESLLNTVYINNTLHFGLRSRKEHTDMLWGDIEMKITSSGDQYLEYSERATKTRTGETSDSRPFPPKMFARPGLAGKNDWEKALADQYVDGMEDMYKGVTTFFWEEDEKTKLTARKKFVDEIAPTMLPKFEKFLSSNPSGFLVGDSLTWADLYFGVYMENFESRANPEFGALLEKHPKIKENLAKIRSLPKIADWIKNRPVNPY